MTIFAPSRTPSDCNCAADPEHCMADEHEVAVPPQASHHHVNTGPTHMPLGLAEHKAHQSRLAARGQRDES
jgi:hypothetical protein